MENQVNVVLASNQNTIKKLTSRFSNDVNFIGVVSEDCLSVLSQENAKLWLNENNKFEDTLFVAENEVYVDRLVSKGITRENIVDYSRFHSTSLLNPLQLHPNTNKRVTKILMGMSHSQCGINIQEPESEWFKMSAPSMDMFCHYHYLKKYLEELPPPIQPTVNHIVIEIPYYIFNYDLSKFGDFVYTKYKYFDDINDYHHVFESRDYQTLSEYKNFIKIFDKQEEIKGMGNGMIINLLRRVRSSFRAILNSDKVWTNIYQETIEENKRYWNLLKELIYKYFPNCRITVLVMPFNPLFWATHKQAVKLQKNIFYETVTGVEIIDEFNYIKNPFCFSDHCHLNAKGASKYTIRFKRLMT